MKTILLALAIIWFGSTALPAQTYPIKSADELQKLVVSADMAQLKLMIFDDTHVYADRLIYFAIMQGLAKDNMPVSIANSVVSEQQGDNFIPGCRICEATKQAFNHYAQFGESNNANKNPYPGLVSTDPLKRQIAIKNLTDKYTSAFISLLRLSDLDNERLQQAMGLLRDQSPTGKACPACASGH